MIDVTINNLRAKIKQAFPEISRDIDNLIGNFIEETMDSTYHTNSFEGLRQDLIYTLNAHKIKYTLEQIDDLFK